ncbi:3-dehydroquinate synthase [Brachybacterium sillae]|uniref:3-dehydroquinate synthase n=1 Tax=Brachybacterium sillae TaxID=2810536 RepID=UPI003D8197A5
MSSSEDLAPCAILIGPMGAGKSTVGRELAGLLHVPFADLDHLVEDAAGCSIPQLFADHGESAFRDLELDTLRSALREHRGVLALGGGAPVREEAQDLLRGGPVVLLTVTAQDVARRLHGGAGRPLLSGDDDPLATWEALAAAREPIYRDLARVVVPSGENPPGATARRVRDALGLGHGVAAPGGGPQTAPARSRPDPSRPDPSRPDPSPGRRSRDHHHPRHHPGRRLPGPARPGVRADLPTHLPERARRALIVHQPSVRELAEDLRELIAASGREAFLAEIPDGEEAKTAQVAGFLWTVLGQAEISRSDVVVGLGGGAATDLAGFVAATWLRGIAVVQVPTTVAAIVDAAVGGKTGINTSEGKNLVGAFHQPRAVLSDLDVLAGLGGHDVAAGLAEAVKCGFIADQRILEIVEIDPRAVLDTGSDAFAEVVERAVRVKAQVVGADPRESDQREILNYGHTLAHAIERNERYLWRHGAAVSIGMVFAAELSHLAGRLSEAEVDRHRRILTSLGLPVTYRGQQWPRLEDAMRRDKKSRSGMLRFVVLDRVGRPSRLEGPDPALLLAAYAAITADA